MNVPKTSSGKPCKLCLKKGGKCHLHCSSKKSSSSPKKSPKKSGSPKRLKSRKSSPKNIHFDEIPLPALYVILINLDRDDLDEACIASRQARKICKLKRFREEYSARQPKNIIGKLTEAGRYVSRQFTKIDFTDENETLVTINYDQNFVLISLVIILPAGINIGLERDPELGHGITSEGDLSIEEMKDIIINLGKKRWLEDSVNIAWEDFEDIGLSEKTAKSIFEEVRRASGLEIFRKLKWK